MIRSTLMWFLAGALTITAATAAAGPMALERTGGHSAQQRVEQHMGPRSILDECGQVLRTARETAETYVRTVVTVITAVAKAVKVLVVTLLHTVVRVIITVVVVLAHAIASILFG